MPIASPPAVVMVSCEYKRGVANNTHKKNVIPFINLFFSVFIVNHSTEFLQVIKLLN